MRYSNKNWIQNGSVWFSPLVIATSFLFLIFPLQEDAALLFAEEPEILEKPRFFMIQNDDFDIFFDVRQSEHIARTLQGVSSDLLTKLEDDFDTDVRGKIKVFLFSSSEQYQNVPRFRYEPEWAAGEAFPREQTMVIILDRLGSYPDIDSISVFTHELSHIVLFDSLKESAVVVPRWFDEGVAMLEARRWGMRDNMQLVSSLITGRYIPLDSLRGRFPSDRYDAEQAYVESFSFITFLVERYGEEAIFRLISEMKIGKDFDLAFSVVFGTDVGDLEKRWVDRITMWYRWIPVVTSSLTLWIAITLLFVFGYIRKKRRNIAVMKRWEEEDSWIH